MDLLQLRQRDVRREHQRDHRGARRQQDDPERPGAAQPLPRLRQLPAGRHAFRAPEHQPPAGPQLHRRRQPGLHLRADDALLGALPQVQQPTPTGGFRRGSGALNLGGRGVTGARETSAAHFHRKPPLGATRRHGHARKNVAGGPTMPTIAFCPAPQNQPAPMPARKKACPASQK